MVTPEKAVSIAGTTLRTTDPVCAGGLLAAKAIGTQLRDSINSGLTLSVISVLGRRLYFFDTAPPNTCATYLGVS